MYTKITPGYIISKKKSTLKKYKKTHRTDVSIKVVPRDVDEKKLDIILNTMIHTGYTFIASYCINNYNLIEISKIHIPDWFTRPGRKKIESKKNKLEQEGIIKPIVVDSSYKLLDGYATLLMLQYCGEKYVPYIINDNYISNKSRCADLEIKKKLYEKQNGICYICGRKTNLDKDAKDKDTYATVDHIIPLSKNGTDSIDNMAIACSICNNLKGSFRYSKALSEVIKLELLEKGLI